MAKKKRLCCVTKGLVEDANVAILGNPLVLAATSSSLRIRMEIVSAERTRGKYAYDNLPVITFIVVVLLVLVSDAFQNRND